MSRALLFYSFSYDIMKYMTNPKINQKLLGAFSAVASGICWGLSGSMGQYLFTYQKMQTPWLVPIRLFLAGLIMLTYCLVKYGPRKSWQPFTNRRDALLTLVYGIPGVALCQFLYFLCIQLSSASMGTILQDLSPVLTLILVCLLSRRRPHRLELIAICFAFLGVLSIVSHGRPGELRVSPLALAAGIGSAIGIAVYNLVGKSILKKYPVAIMQAWAFFWGGIVMALIFQPWHIPYRPNPIGYLGIAFVVLVGNVAAFSLYMTGLNRIGPVPAALYAFSEPVTAAVVTGIFFQTPFSLWDGLGFLLILIMMICISYRPKQA